MVGFLLSLLLLVPLLSNMNLPGWGKEKQIEYVTSVVNKGPFRIVVNDRGTVDSRNNAVLTCKVQGGSTIISIVPQGKQVKKGDLLCELDSLALVDKAKQQKIDLTQAEAALANAKQQYDIQRTQNESDIAAAKLKLSLADLDLRKFKEGEYEQQLQTLEGTLSLKREDFSRAEEALEFTKRMAKKGYRSQSELESQRIAMSKAQIEKRTAELAVDVFKDYTYTRTVKELEANAKEFVLELERVGRKADAALAKAAADLESAKLTHEVQESKYKEVLEQIDACKIYAPQDGEVVYSNIEGGRGQNAVVIEEGAAVRERQAIINLPDVTQMKVTARIHESAIAAIRTGQKALIRVDAYHDKVYNGLITHVSSVPLSGSWPNTDLKEYEVQVDMVDPVEIVKELRPGLNADIEILVNDRQNVLQVPVQAVIKIGMNYFAYKLKPEGYERVEIKAGPTNDSTIEILGGLAEGDRVIMNPRTQFQKEISELALALNAPDPTKEPVEASVASEDAAVGGGPKGPSGPGGRPPGGPGTGGPGGPGAGGPGGPGGGAPNPAAMFKRLDADGDGKLSPEEAPGPLKQNFASADADSDGFLTREELQKAFQNMPRP